MQVTDSYGNPIQFEDHTEAEYNEYDVESLGQVELDRLAAAKAKTEFYGDESTWEHEFEDVNGVSQY